MSTSLDDWPEWDPATACLILDFDGVLAPIVPDPAASQMPAATRSVLDRLVAGIGRVAVVSGRSAQFLSDRVAVTGAEMVGLYGLERVVQGQVVPDGRVQRYAPAIEDARRVLPAAVKEWPGAELEDKGLALAVHWRRAQDRQAAGRALSRAVEGIAGDLAVEDGKMVIELRPPVEADKGTAVALLAQGFEDVAYAGDDLGDLPAFRQVTADGGLAIGVDHGAETDDRIRAAATVMVDGTEGFADWLVALADRV